MERRRRHEECVPDECEVIVGTKCHVALVKERKKGAGVRQRFEYCMEGIDPRLMMLAVLIVAFSFLVNVTLGMRMYQKWTDASIYNG